MFAHFGLAFAPPLDQKPFGTPQTITRRLIKQKARHHPLRGSDTLSAHGCRFCFTPLTAVLFTFPSRYLSTIGHQIVFSLIPWSGRVHAKFHVHRVTQGTTRASSVFGYGSLTLLGAAFHPLLLTVKVPHCGPTTPRSKLPGLGFSVFARHYLRNHARFLFLRLLRCFTSAGVALLALCIQARVIGHSPDRVTPLGNSRVQAPVCGSPGLIAAYHVLHRHLVPRHSPCAFGSLISQSVKVAYNSFLILQ